MYSNRYEELYHHGIKGMAWGKRRWQNPDGSLTPEGYIHYGYGQGEKKHGGLLFKKKDKPNNPYPDEPSFDQYDDTKEYDWKNKNIEGVTFKLDHDYVGYDKESTAKIKFELGSSYTEKEVHKLTYESKINAKQITELCKTKEFNDAMKDTLSYGYEEEYDPKLLETETYNSYTWNGTPLFYKYYNDRYTCYFERNKKGNWTLVEFDD